jgi:hypothetical protein
MCLVTCLVVFCRPWQKKWLVYKTQLISMHIRILNGKKITSDGRTVCRSVLDCTTGGAPGEAMV